MNWIEKIKLFFSRKEKELPPLANVPPTHSQAEACMVTKCGKTESPAYTPQELMSWYGLHKALQSASTTLVNISQIEVIDLISPLSGTFIGTAFAIKDYKGFYWVKIGSDTVYFSKEDAFLYKRAGTFRVLIKEEEKAAIVAVCNYNKKKGEIIAISLLEESKTPPTDYDREHPTPCSVTPCSLYKVGKFIENMTK